MNTPDPFDTRLRNALRELPHGQPPADFARAVVQAAEGRARRLERLCLLLPALAFAPAAFFAGARYGDAWAASFAPVLAAFGGANALNWIAATGACLALSWVLSQVQPAAAR